MKKIFIVCIFFSSFSLMASERDFSRIIDNTMKQAAQQSMLMYHQLRNLGNELLPRSAEKNGKIVTCTSSYWTSGFYPGTLWYLYEYTNMLEIKDAAKTMTYLLKNEQFTTHHHDVGFIMMCSFGNGYRLTADTSYLSILLQSARALSSRFNPVVGCTRSWDTQRWEYPVIIDNMMNMELFTTISQWCGVPVFKQMAVSHADVTLNHHFRENGSSYHLVSYDTLTGNPKQKVTVQGIDDQSSWARGQAWALYGFTMMYRQTGLLRYLMQAKKIADFILAHPRLPKDKIPYWDFDDPAIPHTYRDASAGAIIASALVELSTLTKDRKSSNLYRSVAEEQIRSLSSPVYFAPLGENGCFLLQHSVAHLPKGYEIDQPLSYADYYFVEAMIRYKKAYLE